MSVFDKIDDYFYGRSKKELIYMYVLIAIIIGAVVYYFIYPKTLKYEKKQRTLNAELISKYRRIRVSIDVYRARVSLLNKKINQMQSQLVGLRKKDMFYSELANLLDFAEFNEYKWANIVKNSVKEAKSKGLSVIQLTNHIYDVNITNSKDKSMPHIIKRMDIGLKMIGKYKNFIYFLYNYENRKDLIRVSEMNITSPATFYVKFSIYGYDK
jgi:Tfp pilus assembly protein PilO